MVVGLTVAVGATYLTLQRLAPPAATSNEASLRPAPTSSSPATGSPASAEPATRVVVIGDGFTTGSVQGDLEPTAWPALLEQRLDDAAVEVWAAAGAGYATPNVLGRTLGTLAEEAPVEGADVNVIFGGRADGSGIADRVSIAARQTFTQLRQEAPDADLVVIGPAYPSTDVPAGVRNNRGVISEAAAAVGATFVDPLADTWFVDQPTLLGADGVRPTAEGQQYLADLIEPVVRQAIG